MSNNILRDERLARERRAAMLKSKAPAQSGHVSPSTAENRSGGAYRRGMAPRNELKATLDEAFGTTLMPLNIGPSTYMEDSPVKAIVDVLGRGPAPRPGVRDILSLSSMNGSVPAPSEAKAKTSQEIMDELKAKGMEVAKAPSPGDIVDTYKRVADGDFTPMPRDDTPAANLILEELGRRAAGSDPNTFGGALRYNLARGAQGLLGLGEGIIDLGVGGLNTLASNIASLGGTQPNALSEWFDEGAKYAYDNDIAGSFGRGIEEAVGDKTTGLGRFAGDLYQGAGQLMGTIGAGRVLSGASGLPAELGAKLAIGASAGGGAAQSAYNEGADVNEATLYGLLSGATETAIESISGGIPGLGKGQLTGKLFDKLKGNSQAIQTLVDIVGEGGEEVLSEILAPYYQRMIYDPQAEDATLDELLYAFATGSALSLVGQAGNIAQQTGQGIREMFRGDGRAAPTASEAGGDTQLKAPESAPEGLKSETASTGEAGGKAEALNEYVDYSISKSRFVENPRVVAETVDNFVIGEVSEELSNDIMANYGVDIDGKIHVLNDNDIRHIYNRHGPHTNEKYPITAADIKSIPDIIENYDDVYYVSRRDGKSGLIYEKRHNGTTYYVEQIVGKDNILQNKQMIKTPTGTIPELEGLTQAIETKRNINPAPDDAANAVPRMYVQDVRDDASINIIPQPAEKSNGELPPGTGAAESRFPYMEAATQDALFGNDGTTTHRVVTDREAISKAGERKSFDYDGEKEALFSENTEWDAEEAYLAQMYIADAVDAAQETGDWGEVERLRAKWEAHGTQEGRAMRARRGFDSSRAGMVSEAMVILDGENSRLSSKEAKKAAVLESVNGMAGRFEAAESVQDYADIIRDAAKIRRTGSLIFNRLSGTMNRAIDLVAEQGDVDFLRDAAEKSVRGIAADYNKMSKLEAIKAFRRAAMLSKANTIMRNFVSNNVFDPIDSVSNNISVPLDILLSKFTGTRSVAVDKSWASKAKRRGSLDGLARSIIEVGLDLNGDTRTKYEGVGDRVFKMQGNVLSRIMSTWMKWEGYALQSTDEFQKGGVSAETQRGVDALYDRGLVKDDSLRDAGRREALYRTFQDSTALSRLLTGARGALNNIGLTDARGGSLGAGDFALPFAQVPANLGARAIEYSPVGLVKSAGDLVKVMKKAHDGTLTAAEQSRAVKGIGRGLNGSGAIAIFAALAGKGVIKVLGIGGDDEDKDAEALARSEGRSGTQLNLEAALRLLKGESAEWRDGDTLMSIDFLDPLNALMTTGALIAQDMENEDGGFWDKVGIVVKDSAAGTGQSILDLPMMTKFEDIGNAYDYSDKDTPGGKAIDAVITAIAGEVSSFVPNFIKGIAQGTDNVVRDTYSSDELIQQTVDSVKSGIPGLRETLPAKLDNFGQERTTGEKGLLNILNSNLLPGKITEFRHGGVTQELDRLREATGSSVYPDRKAPGSVTYDTEKYELTPEQKRQYQTARGQLEKDILESMTSGVGYKGLSDEGKAAVIAEAQGYAREFAKLEVLKGMGVRAEASNGYKKAFEAVDKGMEPEDYFVYAHSQGRYDANGSGELDTAEFARSVERSGLSGKARSILWAINYPDWPQEAKELGVDFDVYTRYKTGIYGLTADKDESGKSIDGTKKAKVLAVIDGLDLSIEQKDALYRSEKYSEKELWQAPWHRQ